MCESKTVRFRERFAVEHDAFAVAFASLAASHDDILNDQHRLVVKQIQLWRLRDNTQLAVRKDGRRFVRSAARRSR